MSTKKNSNQQIPGADPANKQKQNQSNEQQAETTAGKMPTEKTATLGYLMAKFPKVPPKIAPAAYFTKAVATTGGSTDTIEEPTMAARSTKKRLVTIEPHIPSVTATSA